jgi:undecaprenyl diphosphate synthase
MSNPSENLLEAPLFSPRELALIDPENIPKHIVIVMDGNRRWAKREGLPPEMGHWQGAQQLDIIVRAAADLGVKTLTVYSFSTENWNRPKHEVEMLMQLLEGYLVNKKEELVKEGVRLKTIGDIDKLPEEVKKALKDTKKATGQGSRIDLVLALNYGGRDEIRRAIVKMGKAHDRGELEWENITEKTISSYLDTAAWEDPELFIRPSGEFRVSNFLVWQISYSEMYVSEVLWPEFSPQDLLHAVLEYQKRNRRYGE